MAEDFNEDQEDIQISDAEKISILQNKIKIEVNDLICSCKE